MSFLDKSNSGEGLNLSTTVNAEKDKNLLDFIEEQKEVKFSDLILFGRKLKRIRKDVNNNLRIIQNTIFRSINIMR